MTAQQPAGPDRTALTRGVAASQPNSVVGLSNAPEGDGVGGGSHIEFFAICPSRVRNPLVGAAHHFIKAGPNEIDLARPR